MNKTHFILVSLLFFITTNSMLAQSPNQTLVQGCLTFEDGEVVVGTNVLAISPSDSTVITYSISDDNGMYRLHIPNKYNRVIISISSIMCEDVNKSIRNTNQTLNFVLKEKETELREVRVTAPKVWGSSDTISYNVMQLSRVNDKTISDVLRNIPGVKVENSGLIRYQGKAISQLYIEGIDLSQGRYALITENVLSKDISTVQILNNHNHIKALQKIRPSDDVAINLKIAKSKQGIWSTNAMIGLGYDGNLLTHSKLTTSYITRTNQHLMVGSIDNTGNPAGNELMQFGKHKGILSSEELEPIASIRKGIEPPIAPEAYVDNFTTYISENSSFSLGKDSQLKLNIDYIYDKELEHSQMYSKFYGISQSEDIMETFETANSEEKAHKFSGSLDYEINKTQKYFNNHLSGYIEKDNANGLVVLNEAEQIVQQQHIDNYQIKNYTHYLIKESAIPFEMISINQYRDGDENFEVPLMQPVNLLQKARYTLFKSDNFISIPDIKLGKSWRYTPVVQVVYNNQSMTVNENLSRDELLESSAKQDFTFLSNKTTLRFSIPVYYRVRNFDRQKYRNWSIEPSFNIKQDLSYMWQISFESAYKKRLPSLMELYPGALYLDYRTKIENETKLYHKQQVSANAKINYNNFMNLFSGYVKVAYKYQDSPVLSSYVATGNNSLKMTLLPVRNKLSAWNMESSVSKGFSWKNLGITLLLGYSNIQGETALKEEVKDYTNQVSNITTKIKMSPLKKVILDYSLQFTKSKFTIVKESDHDNYLVNQTLSLGADILSNIYFDINVDHTYLKYPETHKHFVLLGTSLQYRQNKWDLGFKITNLMNVRYYTLVHNYEYGHFTTKNLLRPRAFLLTLNLNI